jgi:hypothetical protein
MIIFGEIPSSHQVVSTLGGLTLFDTYLPIIMVLGLTMLTLLGLPSPLVSYREIGVLRRLSTTHEPAERPAVVPVRGAGLPDRPLRGQRGRHRIPGQQVGQRHGVVDDGQPGPVRQQPADRDVRLPLSGELRPVPGHWPVEVQLAALREQVRAGRRGGLGGRVHQLQGVPRPRPARPGVGQAAPQVDDLAAVAVDADRRAHVAVAFEVVPEHIPDPLEARGHIALDYDHDTDLTTPHRETRRQLQTTARPGGFVRA